jgi:hypothetical protein
MNNYRLLLQLIYPGQLSEKFPDQVPRQVLIQFYQDLCRNGVSLDFSELSEMVKGRREPSDFQISEWSKARNFYNGSW